MIGSDQITNLCRDAAYGDYPWNQLLQDITEWVGGDRAMLMHSSCGAGYNQSISHNHDPDVLKLYNDHYYHLDPRAQQSLNFQVGETHTGQQILPNDSYKHTAYYSDITRTADVKDSVHGVISDDPELGRRVISIQRSFRSDFFGEGDLKKLRFVMSHLNQAFRDSLRLTRILAQHETPQASIYGLIDPALQLHFFDGPNCRSNKLINSDPLGHKLLVASKSMETIIFDAIRMAADGHRCSISLTNSILSLSPPPLALRWLASDDIAFFVLSEPAPSPEAKLFSAAFSLTPKETEVLCQLLTHRDRKRICEQLNISKETLRWHVKNILSKTGHSNASELVTAFRQNDFSNCS